VLLAVLCVGSGVPATPALLLFPVWLVLLVLTAGGPVLLLAALNVRFRDVRYMVPPLLQAMLLLSPVAYSSASLQGTGRLLYAINPTVGTLEFGRFTLLGAAWPGWQLAISVPSMLTIALLGLLYFQRSQRFFADVI
jgi:ABC-type polysaccharide/polyol phosphate export permease